MVTKYEIRFYINHTSNGTNTVQTNNWFEFMWLRLTKDVIYYRVNMR